MSQTNQHSEKVQTFSGHAIRNRLRHTARVREAAGRQASCACCCRTAHEASRRHEADGDNAERRARRRHTCRDHVGHTFVALVMAAAQGPPLGAL